MKKVYLATPVNGRKESSLQEKKIEALKRCIELRSKMSIAHPDWIVTFSFTVCPINEEIDEPTAMQCCYDLLRHCDIIVLDDSWMKSEGCKKERLFAISHRILVLTLKEALI